MLAWHMSRVAIFPHHATFPSKACRFVLLHGVHCLVERRGGKHLNKDASWSPLFGGAQRGCGSLNQEASWRPLFGGAQGEEKFK